MSEIGGYLEFGGLYQTAYHNKALKLNLARNCLIYILKSKKIKKLYIPYYMCDSIYNAKDYCKIEFYSINDDFVPIFDKKLEKDEYIYIVNYFGMISNCNIKKLKNKYKNIIVDNVQAFFQKPVKDVDTIYSCRKFFGVPDGAYLYTNKYLDEEIERDFSKERLNHIFGRLEKTASECYKDYRENEEKLNLEKLKQMSQITDIIMNTSDYKLIKKRRTENFKYLHDNLKNSNMIKIKNIKGAYAYPYYCENAEYLRKKLIDNKIYVPLLWPNIIKDNMNDKAVDLANKILPLPCDQRYDVKDMKIIVDIIKGRENDE